MKIRLIIITLFIILTAYAFETNKEVANWVNHGHEAEEAVLSKALVIRSKELEKYSGIKFNTNWVPKVSIEWSISTSTDPSQRNIEASYFAEMQEFKFRNSIMSKMFLDHGRIPLAELDPKIVAEDPYFIRLANHELGHALADQVSRRSSGKPFYTVDRFSYEDYYGQIGLNVISEGIGMHFESLTKSDTNGLSELFFPTSLLNNQGYTLDIITLDGGHWVVHDAISYYGEKGLEYLVTHPFKPSDDIRKCALLYKEMVMRELEK